MKDEDQALLRSVSRSFYLSVRFLPTAMREPVALGYLLARLTDTVADAPGIGPEKRIEVLESIRIAVRDGENEPAIDAADLGKEIRHQGERTLLGRSGRLLAWLATLEPANREHLREVILTIIHGQQWDVTHFPPGRTGACDSADQLLRYTYQVAGSVGEFWTKIGFTNLGLRFAAPEEASHMLVRGRKLGQALQLVNILRDLHEDLPAGRCYLPADELRVAGWDGSGPPDAGELEPVYRHWLSVCRGFLEESDRYIEKVNDRRVRFSTRLPRLLAETTVNRLSEAGPSRVLEERIAIPRSEVWKAMARAILC